MKFLVVAHILLFITVHYCRNRINDKRRSRKLDDLFDDDSNPEVTGISRKSVTPNVNTVTPNIGDPDNPLNNNYQVDPRINPNNKKEIISNELYLEKLMRLIRLAQQFRGNPYFNVKLKVQFRSHAFYDSSEAEDEKSEKEIIN